MKSDEMVARLTQALDLVSLSGMNSWQGEDRNPFLGNDLLVFENVDKINQIVTLIREVIASEVQTKPDWADESKGY